MGQEAFYGYKHWTLEEPPRCFYVGKGLKNRERSRCKRNAKWKAVVRRYGLRIEICLGPTTNALACIWEVENIANENTFTTSFSTDDGHNIACNFTRGGDGAPGYKHTDEVKERLRVFNAGKKKSPEAVKKLKENHPMKRPDVAARAAAAHRGKKLGAQSEEHKRKRAESRKLTIARRKLRQASRAWFIRHERQALV